MRFKKIYVEITNCCNMHCSFCIQNSRKQHFMTCEEFTHIIEEIKPYTEMIYMHVLGEPLLHPKIFHFMQIAHEHGLYVQLTTNGTLIEECLEGLCQAPNLRQINISVHSFSQYDESEQTAYLNKIAKAAHTLSDAGKYVSLRLWNMHDDRPSDETIKAIQHFEQLFNIHIDKTQRRQSVKLMKQVFLQFDEVFEWPDLRNPYVSDTGKCLGWKQMCAILCDGKVVPCCLDSKGTEVLGNIFQESFSEILCNKSNLTILDELKSGKIKCELCQHCSYRLRFQKGGF